jgi:hypothetical protein
VRHRETAGAAPGDCVSGTRRLQGRHRETAGAAPGDCGSGTRRLQGRHRETAGAAPGGCRGGTGRLQEPHRKVAGAAPEGCRGLPRNRSPPAWKAVWNCFRAPIPDPSPSLSPRGRGTSIPAPSPPRGEGWGEEWDRWSPVQVDHVSGKGYSLVRRAPLMRAVTSMCTVPVRPLGGVQTTVLPLM